MECPIFPTAIMGWLVVAWLPKCSGKIPAGGANRTCKFLLLHGAVNDRGNRALQSKLNPPIHAVS